MAKQQHNSAIGKRVVAIETSTRRFPKNFPGWSAPNAADLLLEIPIGLAGRITEVESHGHNPWTRYLVYFDDGTWSNGLIIGKDIKLA